MTGKGVQDDGNRCVCGSSRTLATPLISGRCRTQPAVGALLAAYHILPGFMCNFTATLIVVSWLFSYINTGTPLPCVPLMAC